jgi:uncharacterized surface protein with fasciclin (FAS1) repeats
MAASTIQLLSLFITTIVLSANVVDGQNLTFLEIIDADPNLSTFEMALVATKFDFNDYGSPLTLFAPDNAGFDSLGLLRDRWFSQGWSAHLKYFLETHLVAGSLPSSSFPFGSTPLTAVNGEMYFFNKNRRRSLQQAPYDLELESLDGIFYRLNGVILPETLSSSTILDTVATDNFSILNELLTLTGLDGVLLDLDVTATFFAPTDAAFNALGADDLAFYRANTNATTDLLNGHIVLNRVVPSTEVLAGVVELQSESGKTLIFQVEMGEFYTVNGVDVVTLDKVAYNGIAHALSGVITVTGTPTTSPFAPPVPVNSPSPEPSVSPSSVSPPSPQPSSAPFSLPTSAPFVPPSPISPPSLEPVSSPVIVTASPVTPSPVEVVTASPVTPAPVEVVTASPVTPAPVEVVTGSPVTPSPVDVVTPSPVTSSPVDVVTGSPVTPAPVEVVTASPVTPAPAEVVVTGSPVTPAPAEVVTGSPVTPPPVDFVTLSPVTPSPVEVVTLSPVTASPVQIESASPVTPSPVDVPTLAPITATPVQIETVSPVTASPVQLETVSPVTPSPVAIVTFRTIIDSDPEFSTLGQALDAVAFDIDNFDFPATLFAPNNGAFASLNSTFLSTLLSPGWSSHLANVLSLHVVEGAIPSVSLVDGALEAVNGDILTVSVGGIIEISSAGTDSAVVSLPEILSADGVLYELNKVLLPDFVSVSVSEIFATSPDLSFLNELLMLTGLDQLFASRRMMQAVTNGTSDTFTVFAPNNSAFTALGTDALDYYRSNVTATRTLLLGHVVLDEVVSTRSVDAGPVELTSESGDTLTFMSDFKDDGEPIYTVNNVEIVMTDVLANDGIVQVIASVLSVPGADLPDRPSNTPMQASSGPSLVPSAPLPETSAPVFVTNAPFPLTSAPSPIGPPLPSAGPIKPTNVDGMMEKKEMVKSKKMEKVGKRSKKGKVSDKGKGSGSSDNDKGPDSGGKGKGSDSSSKKTKGSVGSVSIGKGKRSKACDENKDPGRSSRNKGSDDKEAGIRGKDGKKVMSCESIPTAKGMNDKKKTEKGISKGSGKLRTTISPKAQTED